MYKIYYSEFGKNYVFLTLNIKTAILIANIKNGIIVIPLKGEKEISYESNKN